MNKLKITKFAFSILLYGLAIRLMDIALWKSLIVAFLIVLGVYIQRDNRT